MIARVPIEVRDANAADLDAVAGLFLQYLAFYEHAADEQRVRDFLRARFASDDTVLLIAEADGKRPAVGLAQAYRSWSSVSLGPVWVLNDLFVEPAARGTGAGRALVRAICERAKEAGAIRVSLATAWDNVAAQGLYESEGFARDVAFLHYAKVTGA
ncbi:GNAT family N-acetyltransferase [Myceligenerans sp. TRM 65318]|uniref:GNAT family N-acetyltransferase n=1 Tax=Myceligenerans pegani TaxID=2776917 RepID=A0ABR9MVA5_9MICO|nr:GNAT family N-acetyltransferase [Myceligenerans sp. TRM 65318]MBE3017593.1 GNAT family N-acetyltransferase [Myceligenerans sp. TRM 65318]